MNMLQPDNNAEKGQKEVSGKAYFSETKSLICLIMPESPKEVLKKDQERMVCRRVNF